MGFNKKEEAKRARFAYKLCRWKGEDGKKLPQNSKGVIAHKRMVKKYVRLYGPLTSGSKRQYENFYNSVLGKPPLKRTKPSGEHKIRIGYLEKNIRRLESSIRRAKVGRIPSFERIIGAYERKVDRIKGNLRGIREDVLKKESEIRHFEDELKTLKEKKG